MKTNMDDRYDWSGLYHDPNDPRLFVPKRIPWLGWTINVEHPYGRLILALILSVILAAFVVGLVASFGRN